MSIRSGLATVAMAAIIVSGCAGHDGSGRGGWSGFAVRSLVTDEETRLGDLAEGPVVLNLWAPWCPPCKAEMPAFDTVAQARGADVAIIGLATGTEEPAAAAFAEEIGVSYDLVYDIDDRALTELGIVGLPATLFIDADGEIVERHSGVLSAAELDAKIDELLP